MVKTQMVDMKLSGFSIFNRLSELQKKLMLGPGGLKTPEIGFVGGYRSFQLNLDG